MQTTLQCIEHLFMQFPYFLPEKTGGDFHRGMTLFALARHDFHFIQSQINSADLASQPIETHIASCRAHSLNLCSAYTALFMRIKESIQQTQDEVILTFNNRQDWHERVGEYVRKAAHLFEQFITLMNDSRNITRIQYQSFLTQLQTHLKQAHPVIWQPIALNAAHDEPKKFPKETVAAAKVFIEKVTLIKQAGLPIEIPLPLSAELTLLSNIVKSEKIIAVLKRSTLLYDLYEKTRITAHTKEFQDKLGPSYLMIYRLQQNLLLLKSWLNLLENPQKLPSEHKLPPEKNYWQRALAVQKFLTEFKYTFLQQQVNTLQKPLIVLVALHNSWLLLNQESQQSSANSLISYLQNQIKTTRHKTLELEANLRTSHVATQCVAKTAGTIAAMPHFKWMELWMRSSEEWTHQASFKNIPIMNERLSATFLRNAALLGGSVCLGVDITILSHIGLSSMLLNGLVQASLTDLSQLSALCVRMGKDELFIFDHMKYINKLVNLIIHVGIYCTILGWSTENVLFLTTGYVFVQLLNTALQYLIKSAVQRLSVENQVTHSYQFATTVMHHVGYMAGTALWFYAAPRLSSSLLTTFTTPPKDDDLIADRNLCYAYSLRCKQAALRLLELNPDDSNEQVRARWSELLGPPPDTLSSSQALAIDMGSISNAYRRLMELEPIISKDPKKLRF